MLPLVNALKICPESLQADGSFVIGRKGNSSFYKAQQVQVYIIEIYFYFPSSG